MTALRASGDDFRGGYQWVAGVTGCRLGAGDKVRGSGGTKLAAQAARLTIVRPYGRAAPGGRPGPAARRRRRTSRRVSRNDTLDVL